MVVFKPFSVLFWVCYVCGGLSDILDGFAARKLKQQTPLGAKLDSVADFIFAAAICAVVLKSVRLPLWSWLGVGAVALLRMVGYGIGFFKFHTFSALHTFLNKTAGGLLFAFPLLYAFMGLLAAGAVVFLAAFLAAVEELLITVKSKELNRDCKSIFSP